MKVTKLANVLSKMKEFESKNSAAILTGMAVAGVFATVIASYKTAKKAETIINEHKDAMKKVEKKDVKEKRKIYFDTAKRLIPAVTPTLLSSGITIGCILASHSKAKKAITVLSAAYSLKDTRLKDVESKMNEVLGVKKAREVKDAVLKEKLKEDGVNNTIIVRDGDVLCKDLYTGRMFPCNATKIDKAIAKVSGEVRASMYCDLNTFYEEIGLESVTMGNKLGWTVDDLVYGTVPIEYTAILTDDNRPCLCLDYSIGLKEDYASFY